MLNSFIKHSGYTIKLSGEGNTVEITRKRGGLTTYVSFEKSADYSVRNNLHLAFRWKPKLQKWAQHVDKYRLGTALRSLFITFMHRKWKLETFKVHVDVS